VIDCRDVVAELVNYLDGEVTAELRREIEAHVAECRTCEAIYDSTRKTLRISTEARTFALPEAASEAIVGRIMRRIRDRARS
jgi:anti-sigma factor (TIGR02949 family)